MKNKIKKEMMVAMKNGNTSKRDILRVLIGEIERREQTTSGHITLPDNQVVSLIKKMVTNIKETTNDVTEITILSEYLPSKLTELDIVAIIQEVVLVENITSMKGMGIIMKHFSTNFPNQYDGKLVSDKIRNILS